MPPKKQKKSVETAQQRHSASAEHWSPQNQGQPLDFALVKRTYEDEIRSNDVSKLRNLELNGYLEHYLWKNMDETACGDASFVFSLLALIQTKANQWETLAKDADKVALLVKALVGIQLASSDAYAEMKATMIQNGIARVWFIQAWDSLFRSFEHESIRTVVGRYTSLPIWSGLSASRLKLELKNYPQLRRHWTHIQAQLSSAEVQQKEAASKPAKGSAKKRRKSDADQPSQGAQPISSEHAEAKFIPSLILEFLQVVASVEPTGELDHFVLRYCERMLELLVDLLSQLHTRRFLRTLLDDLHVTIVCEKSHLAQREEGKLFSQLLDLLRWYMKFEINDQTGRALTRRDVVAEQHDRAQALQRIAYKVFPDKLKQLAFSSHGFITDSDAVRDALQVLDELELKDLCVRLHLIGGDDDHHQLNTYGIDMREFLMSVLVDHFRLNISQLQQINEGSVYPDEKLLWNPSALPSGATFDGSHPLALPKLNLQFLTFFDYLLRNYELFRLESAYEIRQDLVDAVKRLQPKRGVRGDTLFDGWARMAALTQSFTIDEVGKPNIGARVPSMVKATVEIDIGRHTGTTRGEWEELREHDVVFLLCIDMADVNAQSGENGEEGGANAEKSGIRDEEDMTFPSRFGIRYVRACEIFEVRDIDNVVLNDPTRPDERPSGRQGSIRKLRVYMDGAQYHQDLEAGSDVHQTVNVLVRRKAKENNFKGVLQTMRDLMNHESIGRAVPNWLHDVLLGYGDPSSAHYKKMTPNLEQVGPIDFVDTFLDAEHIAESFPNSKVAFATPAAAKGKANKQQPLPPYRLRFETTDDGQELVNVEHYEPVKQSPYAQLQPRRNAVRYTGAQIEAIRSGMSHGLTLVVGPPGTGKTDVCVQLISNLYHTHPTQKVLVLTHSNAALNDVFEKLTHLDIDPRHMLRLGTGERALREDTQMDFSKWGRVNYCLARRQQLLQQVYHLAATLNIHEDVHDNCETAEYFYSFHIQAKIEEFQGRVKAAGSAAAADVVAEHFPFHGFFADAPQPLFGGSTAAANMEQAEVCIRHVRNIFEELNDYRAFELLRTRAHRGDYLVKKEARIVAMTCTHAAIARQRLVELGFKYDSIIMEEAGQVLEVETLIPMLLQDVDKLEGPRLKRVVLIGDHHQLPPVVQHRALQQYSLLEQSMFSRLIRLGVPYVQLDLQGRARPSIAALYNWRYEQLGNFPSVQTAQEFQAANAGFKHTMQLVNVEDFQGRGEFTPTPHFYQNLGEAEYVVGCFQYMRLLGYPAHKITILTTYNGQKHLIRDVLAQRCANPVYGRPAAVTTVDRYQGQQNDYILLSLVRTQAVGHLRDVRRLVVAMSRARLGLYVFCRQRLFENVFELTPVFNQFAVMPSKLELVSGEHFPAARRADETNIETTHTVEDVTAMGVLVYRMHQQLQQMLSTSGASAEVAMDVQHK